VAGGGGGGGGGDAGTQGGDGGGGERDAEGSGGGKRGNAETDGACTSGGGGAGGVGGVGGFDGLAFVGAPPPIAPVDAFLTTSYTTLMGTGGAGATTSGGNGGDGFGGGGEGADFFGGGGGGNYVCPIEGMGCTQRASDPPNPANAGMIVAFPGGATGGAGGASGATNPGIIGTNGVYQVKLVSDLIYRDVMSTIDCTPNSFDLDLDAGQTAAECICVAGAMGTVMVKPGERDSSYGFYETKYDEHQPTELNITFDIDNLGNRNFATQYFVMISTWPQCTPGMTWSSGFYDGSIVVNPYQDLIDVNADYPVTVKGHVAVINGFFFKQLQGHTVAIVEYLPECTGESDISVPEYAFASSNSVRGAGTTVGVNPNGLGKLNSIGSWLAEAVDLGVPPIAWWQWDMGSAQIVTGVVTQGDGTAMATTGFVLTYKVQVGLTEMTLSYVDNGFDFTGNAAPGDAQVKGIFSKNVVARYVRIFPQTWFVLATMRSGVLICEGPEAEGTVVGCGVLTGQKEYIRSYAY